MNLSLSLFSKAAQSRFLTSASLIIPERKRETEVFRDPDVAKHSWRLRGFPALVRPYKHIEVDAALLLR